MNKNIIKLSVISGLLISTYFISDTEKNVNVKQNGNSTLKTTLNKDRKREIGSKLTMDLEAEIKESEVASRSEDDLTIKDEEREVVITETNMAFETFSGQVVENVVIEGDNAKVTFKEAPILEITPQSFNQEEIAINNEDNIAYKEEFNKEVLGNYDYEALTEEDLKIMNSLESL